MMHRAVALVDHLQTLHRPVQNVTVRRPFDPVPEQRDRDHQQPLPARVLNPAPAQPHRDAGDQQRKTEVDRAVIPWRRFRNEFLAKLVLTFLLAAIADSVLKYHIHRSLPGRVIAGGMSQ